MSKDPNSPDTERYQAVALLSEGKLRNVVLLVDLESGKKLTGHRLKVPPNSLPDMIRGRVDAEAKWMQTLTHPRLPRFVACLANSWLLFEFVEGDPLSHHAGNVDVVSSDWIAFWLSQSLEALVSLHARDGVVGGVSPGDLVANDQGLTLVDLGMLDRVFPESSALARSPPQRALMAPEDRYATQHTASGDLFSAAAVAWWLACGRPPDNLQSPSYQRVEELLKARPDMVGPAAEVMANLLSFHAAERFPSAEAALDHMAWAVPALSGQPPPRPREPFRLQTLETRGLDVKTAQSLPLDVKTADFRKKPPPEAMGGGTQEVEYPELPPPSIVPAMSGTLKESMDDVRWAFITRPGQVVPMLLAVVVAVGFLVHHLVGSRPAPPPAAWLRVSTGSILVNTKLSQWDEARTVSQPCLLVASQKAGQADLAFGQDGHLQLQPRTTVRVEGMTDTELALSILQGEASVLMANNVTATLTQQGGVLLCPPGTSIDVTLSSEGVSVRVRQGAITVSWNSPPSRQGGRGSESGGPHHDLRVKAGQAVSMGGTHAEPELEP